ncbi:hypothetical protein BJ170DRAFT_589098 [Xylariales sp. AK1849]|nr:hypothetical protein BJ170DRAFT_589098 [Xylariales sp. AK1849]
MSETFDHILDPDGDMKLILKNLKKSFAPWSEQYLTRFDDSEEYHPELDDIESHELDLSVTFRISSRHLKLASGRSRRLRSEDWTDKVHCTLEDWDPEALLIVLNIIHSRNRNVPHAVSLEILAKIAVVVDYFEFHEAIEPFTSIWMAGLSKCWPETYCRDLVLRIWISSVFGDEKGLTKLKTVAIVDGVGRFADLGLPIPNTILGKRHNYCSYIDLELRQLRADFECGSLGCTRDCRYGILGAMWINLRTYGVFDEAQTISSDYSIAAIYQALREAPPTSVYSKKQRGGRLCCGLDTIIKPLVEEIERRFGHEIKHRVVECSYATLD